MPAPGVTSNEGNRPERFPLALAPSSAVMVAGFQNMEGRPALPEAVPAPASDVAAAPWSRRAKDPAAAAGSTRSRGAAQARTMRPWDGMLGPMGCVATETSGTADATMTGNGLTPG